MKTTKKLLNCVTVHFIVKITLNLHRLLLKVLKKQPYHFSSTIQMSIIQMSISNRRLLILQSNQTQSFWTICNKSIDYISILKWSPLIVSTIILCSLQIWKKTIWQLELDYKLNNIKGLKQSQMIKIAIMQHKQA